MKDMDVLYGIENPMFRQFLKDPGNLAGTLLPWLLRFAGTIGRIYRLGEPVEDFLGRMTVNRSLKDIIDQHFFHKTPAFFAMSYFSLYLGYLYPPGGTGDSDSNRHPGGRHRSAGQTGDGRSGPFLLTIAQEVGTNGGAITGWVFTGGRLPAVQKIQESTRAVRTARSGRIRPRPFLTPH